MKSSLEALHVLLSYVHTMIQLATYNSIIISTLLLKYCCSNAPRELQPHPQPSRPLSDVVQGTRSGYVHVHVHVCAPYKTAVHCGLASLSSGPLTQISCNAEKIGRVWGSDKTTIYTGICTSHAYLQCTLVLQISCDTEKNWESHGMRLGPKLVSTPSQPTCSQFICQH